MSKIITTDEGNHSFDEFFTFKGIEYTVEGEVTNTLSELDSDEYGNGIPSSNDDYRDIELIAVIYGDDSEFIVTDPKLLQEINDELYNY